MCSGELLHPTGRWVQPELQFVKRQSTVDFNRELAYKVLWACVRLLSVRLRQTNDSLRTFLAMSMF